ncbi:MAG: helix-turn-helix domain-containing protein [Arthrobacter sp.]|jgi:excisionase family DNA binding protein|nr:helix-turn-helix domain-containing protein [Arthrobacter sp.]
MSIDDGKKAYTIAEAAETSGISERSIRAEIALSRLSAKKFGSRLLILGPSLDAWLEELPDA